MPQLPSRAMALTGSIFGIITGTLMLVGLVMAIVSIHGFLSGPGVLVASAVGLAELTGIVLGGVGCAARAGPILANAIVFTVLTLVSFAGVAATEGRIHPLAFVAVGLHVLTTVFLWVGFPQAARYRRALASDAAPSTVPARPRAPASTAVATPKPSGPIGESAAAESGDAKVLSVTLQQGMSLLRGDIVLIPGALYFVCAKKGGGMGMVFEGLGRNFGLIGGLIGGALSGAIDGVAENAALKNREQMSGRLDALVAEHKGSFKADPKRLEIVGRSFWSQGLIRVGHQKWHFRGGMPNECRAPLKEWCLANDVRHRNLK